MAIHNDPRLYSAGNVVFNEQPHVALYANLMARKQARDEAFDQYIRNLNKSVNSAGVRHRDRPYFDKLLSDWQNFTMQNRDAIRNRKNGADIEMQRRYQDVMNLVNESKAAEAGKKPVVEMMLDPNKRDRLGDDVINMIDAQDQPLYYQNPEGNWDRNPDFHPIDYSKIQFQDKPFEQDKYFKQFEDIKRAEQEPIVTRNPNTMTETVTTNSVYDPEAKNIIATRATSDYMNNHAFKKTVDQLNPADYNDVFKQSYGRDIQNPADLAAAYTLKGLQSKVTTTKINPDTYERQKAMEAIRFANQQKLVNLRHALDQGDKDKANLWIDDYVDGLVNDAKMQGEYKNNRTGQTVVEKDIPLDPTLAKALTKDKATPDALRVTADGQFRPIFFKRDKDGNLEGKDGTYAVNPISSVPISKEALKLALGKTSGVKHLNQEMSGGQAKHPLPAGKPKTVKQGKFTYTWNENTGTYE